MSDLTPGLEPLFPVYSPGCNFVKGYIYETEAKGYKLQGLYGMNGNLVGFVTNSFSDQTWLTATESEKPKSKKKKKQESNKEQEVTKIIETIKEFWTEAAKDKCGKNYEAITAAHQKSRSHVRYEEVVQPSLQSEDDRFRRLWNKFDDIVHELKKDFDRRIAIEIHKNAQNLHEAKDSISVLRRKLGFMEQELSDHKFAIKQLQRRLHCQDLVAVATVPLIPISRRRKIKAHGHRQEDNG
jgi:hypothetical protein